MNDMFCCSHFDSDISNWDVSNVVKMRSMFYDSQFSKDLSNWRPYKLNILPRMFEEAKCVIPYWAEFNEANRKQAIDLYHLQKELDKELVENIDVENKKQKTNKSIIFYL